MPQTIDDLIRRIKELQEELEVKFKKKRDEFEFIIEEKQGRGA
ncbi:MAG: hypothetical protein WBI04_03590 [Trichlorobacter sp.]|jgi:hypothetical protein